MQITTRLLKLSTAVRAMELSSMEIAGAGKYRQWKIQADENASMEIAGIGKLRHGKYRQITLLENTGSGIYRRSGLENTGRCHYWKIQADHITGKYRHGKCRQRNARAWKIQA